MKLKVLIATLFASFALVACGEGDSNSSNVQSSNSIDGPATTGVAGTTTPTQSLAEEAEAAKTVSADDSKADESTEVVEKEEEEIPGAVEQSAAADDDNPLSTIPREDLPQECLDYFQALEDRLAKFPEAKDAALSAAEEIRQAFETMGGDLEQFAQACKDRYEDFKEENAKLDEQLLRE